MSEPAWRHFVEGVMDDPEYQPDDVSRMSVSTLKAVVDLCTDNPRLVKRAKHELQRRGIKHRKEA